MGGRLTHEQIMMQTLHFVSNQTLYGTIDCASVEREVSVMNFKVLGSVGLIVEGEIRILHGARQRSLLALLLINVGDVVSKAVIFDELWGSQAPTDADNALQALVMRFRKVLRCSFGKEFAHHCLVTRPDGYAMDVDPSTIDVHLFERLTVEARTRLTAEPYVARELLEQALALWQGPALHGVPSGPICHSAVEQFEEARLVAIEDLIRVKIVINGHSAVISELKNVTSRYPWREELSKLLMMCLYRAGRQAEAIQIYNRVRRQLVEEFGMEPSPSLKQCMSAILQQDPALEKPSNGQVHPLLLTSVPVIV